MAPPSILSPPVPPWISVASCCPRLQRAAFLLAGAHSNHPDCSAIQHWSRSSPAGRRRSRWRLDSTHDTAEEASIEGPELSTAGLTTTGFIADRHRHLAVVRSNYYRAVTDRSTRSRPVTRGASGTGGNGPACEGLSDHPSHAIPSPSLSRPYMSLPMTVTGPPTYAGPLPLPPAQSTSDAIGTHGPA